MKKPSNKSLIIHALAFLLNAGLLFVLIFLIPGIAPENDVIGYIATHVERVLFITASILVLFTLTYTYFYFECKRLMGSLTKVLDCLILLDLSIVASLLIGRYLNPNARPFAFLALMAVTLLGRREAIFLNVIFSVLVFIIDINFTDMSNILENCACLLISFCAGTTVIFVSQQIKSRLQSILLVVLLLIPIELIIWLMEVLFNGATVQENALLFAYGAFGAICSVVAFMVFLPVFEVLFAEMTIFRLRELTSDDAGLIKKLKTEAPGTYNHSLVVAQIAFACADAIGEDAELARAAAYYHDVGKLKEPSLFTENQTEHNLHDELTPELSADIIRSHARDGEMLIRKKHLPEIFADIAVQHHGTLPIKYFYAKALKMSDGEVNIANYSYDGPTPQTKIAAIIMIADAAEAATRSLTDRSPEKVEELVQGLIEERIDLDQFKDCDITLKELGMINRAIVTNLCGVYHSRVAYPKVKISRTHSE